MTRCRRTSRRWPRWASPGRRRRRRRLMGGARWVVGYPDRGAAGGRRACHPQADRHADNANHWHQKPTGPGRAATTTRRGGGTERRTRLAAAAHLTAAVELDAVHNHNQGNEGIDGPAGATRCKNYLETPRRQTVIIPVRRRQLRDYSPGAQQPRRRPRPQRGSPRLCAPRYRWWWRHRLDRLYPLRLQQGFSRPAAGLRPGGCECRSITD